MSSHDQVDHHHHLVVAHAEKEMREELINNKDKENREQPQEEGPEGTEDASTKEDVEKHRMEMMEAAQTLINSKVQLIHNECAEIDKKIHDMRIKMVAMQDYADTLKRGSEKEDADSSINKVVASMQEHTESRLEQMRMDLAALQEKKASLQDKHFARIVDTLTGHQGPLTPIGNAGAVAEEESSSKKKRFNLIAFHNGRPGPTFSFGGGLGVKTEIDEQPKKKKKRSPVANSGKKKTQMSRKENMHDDFDNEQFNERLESAAQERATSFQTGEDPLQMCTCRKSRCLKLYCDCFAGSLYCHSNCLCVGCKNTDAPANNPSRVLAIQRILRRKPHAFSAAKGEPIHINTKNAPLVDALLIENGFTRNRQTDAGCNCRRTACLKKYCVCFGSGEYCLDVCGCDGCKNTPGVEKAVLNKRRKAKLDELQRRTPSSSTSPASNNVTPKAKTPSEVETSKNPLAILCEASEESQKKRVSTSNEAAGHNKRVRMT